MIDGPDRRTDTNAPLVGVGVVILQQEKVLLVQRAKPPKAGQWSLPGGLQHLGETLRQTACREALEETGLTIDLRGLVDVIDFIETDDLGGVKRHYSLIDFWATTSGGVPRAGDDAADARWFTRAEWKKLSLWVETERVIEKALKLSENGGLE